MDQFKTREKASEGVKIPLLTPDGKKTDHWLLVRSSWSDEYQAAKNQLFRDATSHGKQIADAPESEKERLSAELDRLRRAKSGAALIVEWSFDGMECSEQAKIDFLIEAPQILAMVEHIAEDNRRFFGEGWTSSSSGESQK